MCIHRLVSGGLAPATDGIETETRKWKIAILSGQLRG
jgi:hypothetical protein